MADAEETQVALRILRAGVPGEHPAIDVDTVALWTERLSSFSGKILVAAAKQWVEDEPRFPNLLDFTRTVEATARRITAQRAALERPVGWIGSGDLQLARCGECGGTDYVQVPDEALPGVLFVRPCSVCQPTYYERWLGGHLDPDHDRFACSDEACRKGHSRRRG